MKYIIQLLSKYRYKYIHVTDNLFTFNRKEKVLKDAMGFVGFTKVPGDYLEFGVWKGGSLASAYYMSKLAGIKDMQFYAFDSFEGLPEKTGVDLEGEDFKKGEYACSEEEVMANLQRVGVDTSQVTTVKGWYDKVLTDDFRKKLPIQSASVVYIDSDLYESCVPVLEWLTPYIVDGTVIIFDDWHCFKSREDMGEQRAFKEWLAKNPGITARQYRSFGWMGESFILNKDYK